MVIRRIIHRYDTAAVWASVNPVLAAGELGAESDTLNIKIGDGVRTWSELPYYTGIQGEQGEQGPPGTVVFDELTPAQREGLKGAAGEPGAKGDKGDKGEPFTYEDFTPEQLAALKGADGTMMFENLTPEQIESLRGAPGINATTTADATATASGLMSSTDKTKLDGVAEGANNYTHPDAHEMSVITGLNEALAGKVPEAPSDNKEYVRKNSAWAQKAADMPEPPADGKQYVRTRADGATAGVWAEVDVSSNRSVVSGEGMLNFGTIAKDATVTKGMDIAGAEANDFVVVVPPPALLSGVSHWGRAKPGGVDITCRNDTGVSIQLPIEPWAALCLGSSTLFESANTLSTQLANGSMTSSGLNTYLSANSSRMDILFHVIRSVKDNATAMAAIAGSSVAITAIAEDVPTLEVLKASTVASAAINGSSAALAIMEASATGRLYFSSSDFIGLCMMDTAQGVNGWVYVDESGNEKTIDQSTFFNSHPSFQTVEETIDGQVMVKFPASYAKAWIGAAGSSAAGKFCIGVSSKSGAAGCQLHPAFYNYDTGAELNQFWMGKFEGSLNGGKVESLSGKTPYVNVTQSDFDTACRARGTGWHCKNIWETMYIGTLLLIKGKSGDTQAVYGRGNVDNSPANAVSTGTPSLYTLGLNSWWGNVREWVTGIQSDASMQIEVWKPGVNKSFVNMGFSMVDGNVKNFKTGASSGLNNRDMGLLLLNDTNSGADIAGDYQNSSTSAVATVHGGNWVEASSAGAFYLNVNFSAASTSAAIGGRLAKW